jgi:uncharacterized protein
MIWKFYGRSSELNHLEKIYKRGQFFFLKVEGRRRIGKTRLILKSLDSHKEKTIFCKIPDADETALSLEWKNSLKQLDTLKSSEEKTFEKYWQPGFRGLTDSLVQLVTQGHIAVFDEFQYLTQKNLKIGQDFFQEAVDRLRNTEGVRGGIIVMGSIASEMEELLSNRSTPLFGRLTDVLSVGHWDLKSLVEMADHQLHNFSGNYAQHLLSLWNLFEGVPKFYQDASLRDVISEPIPQLVSELFLSDSAPLAVEAEQWFLRELKGSYSPILRYIAEHEGKTYADIVAHISQFSEHSFEQTKKQNFGGYFQALESRFDLIESRNPLNAERTSRRKKYYLKDRFLRSYLAALAPAINSVLLPLEKRVHRSIEALQDLEGLSFEILMKKTLIELVASEKAPFMIESPQQIGSYWNKSGEADLFALDYSNSTLWTISCKRNGSKHSAKIKNEYEFLASLFLKENFKTLSYKSIEKIKIRHLCLSPNFSRDEKKYIHNFGAVAFSLQQAIELVR